MRITLNVVRYLLISILLLGCTEVPHPDTLDILDILVTMVTMVTLDQAGDIGDSDHHVTALPSTSREMFDMMTMLLYQVPFEREYPCVVDYMSTNTYR